MLCMVSSTCTAVAGSLTAGDRARRPMSARSRNANSGSWWKVRSCPIYQPTQEGRVSRVATAQIGNRVTLLEGVAYAHLQHDDRAVSRAEQARQVDLLQGGLPMWPYDGAAQWRQHSGGTWAGGPGSAVQVIEDRAALCGDRRQRRCQLNGRKGSHLQDTHQGDGQKDGRYFHRWHDYRHLRVVTDDQGSGDREHEHAYGEAERPPYDRVVTE